MPLTLADTLRDHQRSPRRRPAVQVSFARSRFGVPLLPFELLDVSGEPDCPVDAVASPRITAARNNAGSLDTMNDSAFNTWTNVDTVTSGQGFAIRWDETGGKFGLAYGDGNDLKYRDSSDGITWSAATTLVTEASAIGAVALAFDPFGDACVFYVLGTTTTLKRLRRTSGSWAGSGTTWSKTGSVASLTGASAVWDSDYTLVLTGTEVTTTHRRVWAVTMGDTVFPANAWSGLRAIAEADAASGTSFSCPHVALVNGITHATFEQTEAGNVASSRVMLTHATETAGPLGWWTEPAPPIPAPGSTHGAALLDWTDDGFHHVDLLLPSQYWGVTLQPPLDLSDKLLSLSWQQTTESLRLRAEFENVVGGYYQPGNQLRPGYDLTVSHGFLSASDGSAEHGMQLRCQVSRVRYVVEPGRGRIVVEAEGPWEALARFHAPQAWTAPSGTKRGQIFARLAGKAGFEVSAAAAPIDPSTAWTTDTPAFAVAANETGAATLRRLLAPTTDFVRASASGQLEIVGSGEGGSGYDWALKTGDGLQILSFALIDEAESNWFRVQGPDRYADSFTVDDLPDDYWQGPPPLFQLLRDQDASSDAAAIAAAENARNRERLTAVRGELVGVANVGVELWDTISYELAPFQSLATASDAHRVIGLALDYRRGPASGAPAYNVTLTLGRL